MATKLKVKTIEPATGTTLSLGNPDDAVTVSSDSIKVNTWKDSGDNTLWTSDGSGAITSINSGLSGGGYTLIKTETASNDATVSFVDGTSDVVLDSTYDEYMFVFTDINPATDSAEFQFQVNATDDAGGGYDTSVISSTFFRSYHSEGDATDFSYQTGYDLAQESGFQTISADIGNDSDGSTAGILHLFNLSSTTFVKHFYSRFSTMRDVSAENDAFAAGYINDTTAIDEIQFKMSSGNFDGVIQLYGVS